MQDLARVVLAGALILLEGVAHARSPVVVLPLGDGEDYRATSQAALAIREQLVAAGQTTQDPAQIITVLVSPPTELLAQAQEKFRRGVKFYENLEFRRARTPFQEAVEQQRAAMQQGAAAGDYVRQLHYLAATFFYDNDQERASRIYADAIAFAPQQRPDPATFSPDVMKVFDGARNAAKADGALEVFTTPSVDVYVDGKLRGISPLSLKRLLPGRHLVQLKRAGYESETIWTSVPAASAGNLQIDLKPTLQLPTYSKALAAATQEMSGSRPGAGTEKLQRLLHTPSVILVVRRGEQLVAAWCEEGTAWTRRYQGRVAEGDERAFAEALMRSSVVVPKAGCEQSWECQRGQECVSGRCVVARSQEATGPIYKRWWFWTIVGAAAAGATAGIILGVNGSKEQWTAEVQPRVER